MNIARKCQTFESLKENIISENVNNQFSNIFWKIFNAFAFNIFSLDSNEKEIVNFDVININQDFGRNYET